MTAASHPALRASCPLRRDLANEFAIAARLHAEAVVSLTSSVLDRAEFDRLRRAAKQAQERSEAARTRFEDHLMMHNCFDGPTS